MTRPLAYFLHILAALSPVPALARTVLVLSARSEAAETRSRLEYQRAQAYSDSIDLDAARRRALHALLDRADCAFRNRPLSVRIGALIEAADIQRGRADSLEAQLAACTRAREQLAAELELLRRQITAVRAEDDDNAALAGKDLQIQEHDS